MSKFTTKWIADDAVTKEKINADVAGDGVGQNANGSLELNVDNSTVEVATDTLQVKGLGIDTAQLAAQSVTAAKLGSDVAGDGLTGGSGSDIDVQADTTGSANVAAAINVDPTNGVGVKIDADTIVENGSKQLAVGANSIGANEIDEGDNYTWTGTHDFTATTVDVASPTSDNHVVNKAYADALRSGIQAKGVAKALSTADETLTGLPSNIDGVTSWAAGDIVLLTGQSPATENGLWEVQTTAWTRPDNFLAGESASGSTVWIDQGVTYGETQWGCTTDLPNDIVDTNNLAWVQTSGAGQVTAGTGLTKSGNTIRVGDGSTGDINGINRTASQLAVAVDNTTLEISSEQVIVKDLGISTAKLAATSVTAAKLGSDVAGDGLTGGNGSDIDVLADPTGGPNLAKVINVSANGVAVKVDASTINENGSGQLEVPDGGITEAELNATVAGLGIAGGAGTALSLDITELTEETTPDNDDFVAVYDDSATAHRKMKLSNLIDLTDVENKKQYMHKITSGEETAGYFTLPSNPITVQSVSLTPVGGGQQVNKQAVGSTGVSPDFDVLNVNQVHINNNGAATGLSEELEEDDVVIVEYSE